jgi:AmmeMemoRadiSam system protein B
MVRKPAVAGQFYPAAQAELRHMIEECTPQNEQKVKALGILVPHAGYVFSGPTAGKVFARVEVPKTVVLLNPSHHYYGPDCALWTGGPWQTPLGQVALHEELCRALARLSCVTQDDTVHLPEHSGEVVLPFIQYHCPEARVAVICVTSSATTRTLVALGEGIKQALDECGEPDGLVVASSDLSHEQGGRALERVNSQDPLAIEKMQQLDPEGLVRVCREKSITMCGVLPAAAMMASVKARGGKEAVLVARATSADSPYGRGNYVVGYAGMIFR